MAHSARVSRFGARPYSQVVQKEPLKSPSRLAEGMLLEFLTMSLDFDWLTAKARVYVGVMIALGLVVLTLAAIRWESPDLVKFGGFLMVAVFSSGMRLKVPGVTGMLSLTFLFVLFGVVELNGPETVFMGAVDHVMV